MGWGIDLIWGEMSVLFGWQIVWWNTENFGDSQELANFSRTPTSTSLAGISPAKFTDKSRQRFANSKENMEKNTNGCSYNTINCSPQVIPVHLQDFTVYQKYIKQIVQCIL